LYAGSALWSAGEPNGDQLENCAAINPAGQLIDFSCSSSTPRTACHLPQSLVLKLRGLASVPSMMDSIDNKYVLMVNNTNPEQIYFQGYYDTEIRLKIISNR
jgi:hypothetical protein